MSVDTIKAELAKRDTNGEPTVFDLIERQTPEIRRALPAHMSADRLARIALTLVRKTPLLASCTAPSLLGALMTAAQVGLEPGPLGHCWLIPRWNKKLQAYECHWEIGYTGVQELARRSGLIGSIEARPVFEADAFDFEHGSAPFLRHKPSLSAERGNRVAFYAYVEVLNGRDVFRVMPLHEVERIRDEYGGGGATGPWVTDFDAMAAKTVVRAMRNYLPQSPLMAQAFNVDGTVRHELSPDALDAPREIQASRPDGAGVAETEQPAADLEGRFGGGTVEADQVETVPPAFPTPDEIDAATVPQLRGMAERFGIDTPSSATKAELRELLLAAEPFDVEPEVEE